MEKQILMGLIDEKINELAKAIPAAMRDSFNQLDLEARICGIGFFACLSGDNEIAKNCSEWLKMIK